MQISLHLAGIRIYGPTGVGVLYGKEEWLDKLPPYQGGGEMIASVSFEKTTFNELPFKFEAGTPDYIGSTALAEACAMLVVWEWILLRHMKMSYFVMRPIN